MTNQLTSLRIKNFRSLADITIHPNTLNVLFGPNGAGKSTFLDTLWLIRDCAIRGVETATSYRSHGIGMLWDKAEPGAAIEITVESVHACYALTFSFSSGRIETYLGERLTDKSSGQTLIERGLGSDKVTFYHTGMRQTGQYALNEPDKLALSQYLYFDKVPAAIEMDRLLRFINYHPARLPNLRMLKQNGSEVGSQIRLLETAQNLISVLRNLHDRQDERYITIIRFMRESLPGFDALRFEQTGPTSVYATLDDRRRRDPINLSGVSDGHLQMLILLTALFSEGRVGRDSILLFDEPETSLHPYALAKFAEATKLAAQEWGKQIFIATHSPVLISQFDATEIIAVEIGLDDTTQMKRVSDIPEVQDLLEKYAAGSLYMSELIAPQGRLPDLEARQ